MIREIIKPQNNTYLLNIPEEYINKEVEILLLPVNTEEARIDHLKNIIRKTSGILSANEVDPVSWQRQLRKEWDSRS
ncbi:MAG: hypothetical protein D5R98_01435 [Desulfonatronovibrio sp. MSAO_Bac4]|nr:MAG: hypothetical protein D5R98_01435 [Desulfonatronovibrio sp. MSAO_Bac4]